MLNLINKVIFFFTFIFCILILPSCTVQQLDSPENKIFIANEYRFEYYGDWTAVGTDAINERRIIFNTGEYGPDLRIYHNSGLIIPSIPTKDQEDLFSESHPPFKEVKITEISKVEIDGISGKKRVIFYTYDRKEQRQIEYYFPDADFYIVMKGDRSTFSELKLEELVFSLDFTLENQPGDIPVRFVEDNLLMEYSFDDMPEYIMQPWAINGRLVACRSFEDGLESDRVSFYIINSSSVLYRFPDINSSALSKGEIFQKVTDMYIVEDEKSSYSPEVYISCQYTHKNDTYVTFSKTYCFKRSGDGFILLSEAIE